MKKFLIIFSILFLILLTAFIKNSTKKIEDEVFLFQENIRVLKKEFEKIKLEFDYLSSSENLLQFQNLYFDDELIRKDIKKIHILKNGEEIDIKQFKISNE
jgi:hypothetical protein|tara:strand:- start:486 stop:788 length:303 start_codon:yes stop_codon:yes gene_type:complete